MIKKSGNNMSKGKKWQKGKYKVINWWTYNKDLKKRGYLTIWFTQEGIEQLIEEEASVKFRGRQREYSDTAIQAMYTIRQVFNLRLMSVLMNSVPPVLMKIVPPKKRFNKINNVYFLVI